MLPLDLEWLETDGLGGFASGTVGGIRTRRYHALLLAATTPPTGRMVLVNGMEARVETPAGSFPLSSQRYLPDVVHPAGRDRIESFARQPWPRWVFRLEDGTRLEHELFVCHGRPMAALRWRLLTPARRAVLSMRPLLSGRDYHLLHRENPAFDFRPAEAGPAVAWRPYAGVPGVQAVTNGKYGHAPLWFRNFLYLKERERGLDDVEDLASPGCFTWDLTAGDAICLFSVADDGPPPESAVAAYEALRGAESHRRHWGALSTPIDRVADAYLVRRGAGRTIVAGYPWFTDWGRDTFIAMRGLCLARGDLTSASQILLAWSGAVSEGMLPNRFPDHGAAPEYNSVDASLWYVIAVHEFLAAAAAAGFKVAEADRTALTTSVDAILTGYSRGTRFGIRADDDGLLAAGEPGVQLTWMDAKVGDWVVTPRIGKPVEIQALWLNALWTGRRYLPARYWAAAIELGLTSFRRKFWNAARSALFDVVDVDHIPGRTDATLRPNQIFAVGGLPLPLIADRAQARTIVDTVESQLWTGHGLRSLAPGEPGYAPQCVGAVRQRDGAYHQGTVWPWLTGAFVEAWLRVRNFAPEAVAEAQSRFILPTQALMDSAGLGHIPEILDAEPPHTPRGCPWQAWSLGEFLRLTHIVLRHPPTTWP